MKLLEQLYKGDRRALARAISVVENREGSYQDIINALFPKTGHAFILGITGPPGAGKSTVTDRIVTALRAQGERVAVVAIDPSSPFTGGAILGDRIRMQSHIGDAGVYIRSLGTRGKHGGLSHASKDIVMVLDAAGYDWIIVETAGVGQTELDILKLAHGIAVILVPESGDGIQMMKAGLMEIADVFVVNKCDRPESDKIVREITNMVGIGDALGAGHDGSGNGQEWAVPVLKTEAITNTGINELVAAVRSFKVFAEKTGRIQAKQAEFYRDEIIDILTDQLTHQLRSVFAGADGQKILQQVLSKKLSPFAAAKQLSATNT